MKITWVTRSFLDYRIPVYEELDRLCGNQLSVIFFADVVPQRCREKLGKILGERSIGLSGEIRLSGKKLQPATSTLVKGLRVPVQPGLIKNIRKTEPDVIITDGFFQWTYSALFLRFFKRIPHIMCYEATLHTERNISRFRELYRRLASRYIDHIFCNGSLSSEYVLTLGYPEEKISLGNMTADIKGLQTKMQELTELEKSGIKRELRTNGKVMIFTGRLVPLKGIDRLIEVWKSVFKSNSGISLLIIGDGDQKEQLERKCREDGIGNIIFGGSVDYDSICKYLGIADICIMPSLRDNWSLVVPEAMSCGLPVICSKYNGCWPELVKPENGWVFDPLDSEDFLKTLTIAWENRDKWADMGKESLRIVENYAPDKIAGSIYSACKSLV